MSERSDDRRSGDERRGAGAEQVASLPIDDVTDLWVLIEARAELSPHRRMLSDEHGRSLTFGEYRRAAERVAAGLEALGVRRDHVVSYQLPTTLECAVLMAALSRLGARQNPIIPILREAEVGHIIGEVASNWLIHPGTWRGFDYSQLAHAVTAGTECAVLECSVAGHGQGQLGLPATDPAGLAAYAPSTDIRWYFYSSGTTAAPKGAKHTDVSVMAASNAGVACWGTRSTDVIPVATPMTHIAGVMQLTTALRVAPEYVLFESFDPAASPLAMAERGATMLGSAVPFFVAYLDAQSAQSRRLFPNLRVGVAGGAPFPPELHRRVRDELGGRGVINAWGLTECPASLSVSFDDPEEAFQGTVGREVPGVEVRLVTLDGGQAAPGEVGELVVRGPQLCAGYVDERLDAEAFTEDGFFRTGDLGVRDELGNVRVTGRIKDIIIRNAENISAVEVEDVLHRHPSIADVAVIGVPDPRTGERCCAVVTLAPGVEALTLAELVDHCRAAGLAVQKSPERIEIVEQIPRNAMGKIQKHALRRRFAGAGAG